MPHPAPALRSPAPPVRFLRLGALGLTAALALGACGAAGPSIAPESASTGPSTAPSSAPSTAPSAPASASPAASAPVPSASAAAAQLLLEAHSEGGFINPAASIGALPTVVVDTDGKIYTPALAPDGPLGIVPTVTVHDVGASGAAEILAAAKAAGLVDGTGGGGVVADTGSTVITLEVDGNEVVTRVANGGPAGPGGPGVHPGASQSAGASSAPGSAVIAFLAKLTDPTTPWGGATAPATTYTPTAYRVWVAPTDAGGTGGAAAAWPLSVDPNVFGAPAAADLGVSGLRSGVVSGADATTLAKALVSVPAGSTLSASGHAYQVWIRPLLPDELGG